MVDDTHPSLWQPKRHRAILSFHNERLALETTPIVHRATCNRAWSTIRGNRFVSFAFCVLTARNLAEEPPYRMSIINMCPYRWNARIHPKLRILCQRLPRCETPELPEPMQCICQGNRHDANTLTSSRAPADHETRRDPHPHCHLTATAAC